MRLTHAEASSCNAIVLGFGLGFASCCDFFLIFDLMSLMSGILGEEDTPM